jgi:transposase
MLSPQASPIHLSSLQQDLLQRLVKRTTSEQRLVKRGHIILEAAGGTSNTKIAQHQQVDYETVRRWRDRWHAAESRLQARDRGRQAKTAESGDRSALDR